MSLPKTYKVQVFEEKGQPLVLKEFELKPPQAGEVLAKVLACGVCHSDEVVKHGGFGNGFPIAPGHEAIGDVVAVAEGEKYWKVGDRVGAAWHGGHDGTCKACKRGLFQMCQNEQVNGVSRNGGYGEYVYIRSEAAVPIPKDGDPAALAPLLCAGVTVFNSLRKQGITLGDTVAIQGLGGLGHLALQYTSKMGYRTVAISSSGSKRDFAKKLGAHEYIDGSKGDVGEQLQKLGGASCILLTAPSDELVPKLMNGLGMLGKLVILAAIPTPVPINTSSMINQGLSIVAWPSGHALDSEEAISFAQVHGVNCMIEKFPLEKANDAMDHMNSGKVRFRGVLIPGYKG
ncbi:alcohol dehydrogenase [Clohesyomyces aquaticus]|uniref:Alcohol dehydrogenase n=1 Tax=Clohesyomyces aquaticus TaxID=1231657 RepID=A0A1Y1ZJ31_9PLEO|nr:alcohol dehydrogenase [Clohesyomyces aquaticus]